MGKRHLLPLEAGRIRLRLLEESDLPRTLAWRNQDHIRRWFLFSQRLTPEQHAGWFAAYRQRDDDFVFVIEEQSSRHTPCAVRPAAPAAGLILDFEDGGITWRPIGQVAIYNIDWQRGTAEFGRLMIGEADASGRGLARDATDAAIAVAIEQFGLQEVYLEVIPSNERAIKLYEACGFEISCSTEQILRMTKRVAAALVVPPLGGIFADHECMAPRRDCKRNSA